MEALLQQGSGVAQQAWAQLVPPLDGGPRDLLLPLYIGFGVLAVRLAAEAVVLPGFRRLLKPHVPPERLDRTAFKVFENAFTCTFSGSLAAWAWAVTLRDNGGCTPFTTAACLQPWPAIPLTRGFQIVWLSIAGYYTYEMIGTLLRVGCILATEMVVHHVITMVMMLYGYFYGLSRYGLMATALLDTSNTLLHAAKALNYADVPALARLKNAVSKAFAATFFVCRVALPPFALIAPGLTDGRVLPRTTFVVTNGLLLMIYSLQLFWFHKIMRIALGYVDHEGTPTPPPSPPHSPSTPTAEVCAAHGAAASGLLAAAAGAAGAPAGDGGGVLKAKKVA